MKKLFLLFIMTALTATVWSQSTLSTIRGKTRDGKTIKVEYYQGSVEDLVESVKYQLVDELQAKVAELQGKLDEANRQIKELKEKVKGGDSNDAETKRLRNQIAEKENQISNLNKQITELNKSLDNLQNQLVTSELSVDSLIAANADLSKQLEKATGTVTVITDPKPDPAQEKELRRLRDSIVSKDATIRTLNRNIADCEKRINGLENDLRVYQNAHATGGLPRPMKTPVVGVEFGFGPVFMRDDMEEGWAKDVNWAKMFDVYFGTARLSDDFPISVEVGAGIRSFKLSAEKGATTQTIVATDADGDSYQAIYTFGTLNEKLSLTYVDIPVRICFGQPAKDRVSVYAKLGLTPSINIASTFTGSGKYDLKGYYPQWDVTLEDIAELGFGSDMDWYAADKQPETNSFILWGNVALGAYVPFGSAPVLLNGGLRLDFPFMGIGTAAEGMGMLGNGGKVVIPSFELGLVYSLK